MPLNEIFNQDKFSKEIDRFAGNKPLRVCAREIGGVSASTLSRIIRGKPPDLETFGRICEWLLTSPSEFFTLDIPD